MLKLRLRSAGEARNLGIRSRNCLQNWDDHGCVCVIYVYIIIYIIIYIYLYLFAMYNMIHIYLLNTIVYHNKYSDTYVHVHLITSQFREEKHTTIEKDVLPHESSSHEAALLLCRGADNVHI